MNSQGSQQAVAGTHYVTQEERLEYRKGKESLHIGIPREISFNERRVGLVPAAVALLSAHGHQVVLENGAGKQAGYSDKDYSEAGARIVYSRDEVFKAGIILKVAPPTSAEIALIRPRQIVLSTLNWYALSKEYFHKLNARKATALAFEYIHDSSGSAPLIRSMSEIAGNTVIYIASHYLSDLQHGQGMMFGGFSGIIPTELVILGAGTVGEFAARAALGMGASVKVFDNSIYKLRRIQNNLQNRLYTSIIEPGILGKAIAGADVVIGAMYDPRGRLPLLIPEDMVRSMKEGSVIIDVSIDHGGCFETSTLTTHENPVVRRHGVIHYGVPNIPSMVPKTASLALSNFFAPLLVRVGEAAGFESLLRTDPHLREGVYLFNGSATRRFIAEQFDLPFSDFGLLMAAMG